MIDKNKIKIRKLTASDAEQYVKLHNIVWRHAYKHIFPKEVFEDRDARTQSRIDSFADWIDSNPNQINYCAEVDGKIVGCMSATISSNYDHFKQQNYAELMGLYILPEYQGIGIGSIFKKLFVDWAKEHGATKYVIGVLKDNHNARKIYEKWGEDLQMQFKVFIHKKDLMRSFLRDIYVI